MADSRTRQEILNIIGPDRDHGTVAYWIRVNCRGSAPRNAILLLLLLLLATAIFSTRDARRASDLVRRGISRNFHSAVWHRDPLALPDKKTVLTPKVAVLQWDVLYESLHVAGSCTRARAENYWDDPEEDPDNEIQNTEEAVHPELLQQGEIESRVNFTSNDSFVVIAGAPPDALETKQGRNVIDCLRHLKFNFAITIPEKARNVCSLRDAWMISLNGHALERTDRVLIRPENPTEKLGDKSRAPNAELLFLPPGCLDDQNSWHVALLKYFDWVRNFWSGLDPQLLRERRRTVSVAIQRVCVLDGRDSISAEAFDNSGTPAMTLSPDVYTIKAILSLLPRAEDSDRQVTSDGIVMAIAHSPRSAPTSRTVKGYDVYFPERSVNQTGTVVQIQIERVENDDTLMKTKDKKKRRRWQMIQASFDSIFSLPDK